MNYRSWTITVPVGEIAYWYGLIGGALAIPFVAFYLFYMRQCISPKPRVTAMKVLSGLVFGAALWPWGLWECLDFFMRNEPHRRRNRK